MNQQPAAGKRPRVLLTCTARYPFVQDDIEMLGRHVDLDIYIGSGVGGAWENFRRAMRADVIFCWFGSVYAFFAVLGGVVAGRRSIIMLGGVDVANEPELEYGIWRSRWKGALLSWALRKADKVYAVDPSLRRTLERSSGKRWEKVEWLPTGYDISFWEPRFPKEPVVLTVATCNSLKRGEVKGIDLLIEAARRLPAIRFRAIGIEPGVIEELRASAPGNIELLPPVPRAALLEEYQRSRVYCQPSRREGLPNALCEAMLCGCIPVGTNIGGIPTAIDGAGFVVEPGSPEELCRGIIAAMEAPDDLGERAHRFIAEHFPRERRERELLRTIMQPGGAEAIH